MIKNVKRSYRAVALLGIIVLLVAACAGPATSGTGAAALESSESRVVTHALGETTVTGMPQRIVTLEWSFTEYVLALGVQPVGVADIEGYHSWVKIPVQLSPDVTDVGTRQEPNLETIAGLDPDLILAPANRIAETYDELSAIAPTLAFDAYPADESVTQYDQMRKTFLTVADLLDRRSEGDAVLAHMEQTFAEAQTVLDASGATDIPFVLTQAFGDDTVQARLFTDNALAVQILEQLGLENGWDDGFQLYGFTAVSVETLPELGNVHFFYVVQDDNNVFAREAIRPLWESLEFVQAGQAYPLGGDTWLFGGPLSAEALVARVLEALAPDATVAVQESTGNRSIVHAMDQTEVPASPQRVVVLDTGELDSALALGVKPVGAPVADAQAYQEYLSDQLAGIADTGSISEPNLEAILALEPDLILGSKQRHESIYPQLSQIAPTVFVESLRVPWQENFRLYAEALGKASEADTLIAEYDAHVAEVRAALGDRLESTTVSVIRFRPGQVRLYLKSSFVGYILQDVGIRRPPAQDRDQFSAEISLEQVADADADYIFVTGYATEDSDMATFLASPIWGALAGVQQGHVIDVDDDTWISGLGIQAAHHVLDDLIAYLGAE